jgi:hypothetical protein
MKRATPIIFSILFAVILFGSFYLTDIKISLEQKNKLENSNLPLDSFIFNKREAGDILFSKFVEAVISLNGFDSSLIIVSKKKDSLSILKPSGWEPNEFRRIFYNDRDENKWEKLYSNLPVQISTNISHYSFTAKIDSINGKAYLYLPYEILFSVVNNSSRINKVIPNNSQKVNINTITPEIAEEIVSAKKGTLIQTEGIVWKHVSELIAKANLQNSSNVTQLCYLWKYAKDNWVYINDPVTVNHEDTWRSASETIETYYFDNTHKYTGDCDDFAILVASFARQIGLESRFIGAYGAEGGHAYSEFFVTDNDWNKSEYEIHNYFRFNEEVKHHNSLTGKWVNLDWFGNHVGGDYFNGTPKIYDL